MPTYLYKCKKCAKEFEVEQSIKESPLEKCLDEKCEGILKRVIQPTTFILKGSGWFKDGYTKKK